MCLKIDITVTSLSKRTVWKVFDSQNGEIVSLYKGAKYPKGKLIERSRGNPVDKRFPWEGPRGTHGLHFYTSKARAKAEANIWSSSYIAKFSVDPQDFMYMNASKSEAMYQRATRVGNFIKVRGND